MAGGGDEAVIGLVVGRSEDGSETLLLGASIRGVELELVHPLLVEQNRAGGAINLDGDAALAAPGGAVGDEHGGNAAFEFQKHAGKIVCFHSAFTTTLQGAGFVGLHHIGDRAFGVAEQGKEQR